MCQKYGVYGINNSLNETLTLRTFNWFFAREPLEVGTKKRSVCGLEQPTIFLLIVVCVRRD
jgi:hypothetical protein